jgi:hypothetical protein
MEQDDQATDEEDESYQEADNNVQEEDDSLADNDYLPEEKGLTDQLAMRSKGNRHPPSWYEDYKSLANSLLVAVDLHSVIVIKKGMLPYHRILVSQMSLK